LFATKEFIEASRKFVCIRIETYENKKSEAMVRKLLGGKFANTAFAIFNPTGTQQLSRGRILTHFVKRSTSHRQTKDSLFTSMLPIKRHE